MIYAKFLFEAISDPYKTAKSINAIPLFKKSIFAQTQRQIAILVVFTVKKEPLPEIYKKPHRREKCQSLAEKLSSNGHKKNTVVENQRSPPPKSIRNISTKKNRNDFTKNTLNLRHEKHICRVQNPII